MQLKCGLAYSLADLQQVCSETQISPHIVGKAVRNVEERQQLREYIKQSAKRGISVGIMLLIPAIAAKWFSTGAST